MGHVAQLAAQFGRQLALDEAIQKQREQDADQRADQEERDRDLASEPHPVVNRITSSDPLVGSPQVFPLQIMGAAR